MENVQHVIIDREATNTAKLTQAITPVLAPTVTTAAGTLRNGVLGDGVVKYRTLFTGTGSAAAQPIFVPKPHRLLRVECLQVVTSTGVEDTTAMTVLLKRIVGNIGANPNAQVTLFSTNGAQAVDTVEFVASNSWVEDGCEYILNGNLNASNSLYSYWYIQYL